MSDLKQCEQEYEADALRINGDRKPKFGDLMRNPWASEGNPQRDGYFVREWRQGGKFNPGHYYELTDKCGKFWETQAKYAFFIDTQPEATAPAKDLSAAILALPLPNTNLTTEVAGYRVPVYGAQHMRDFAIYALASAANALSEGDSENTPVFDLLKRAIGVIALHDDAEAKAIAADARAILQSQKDNHG